MKEQVTEKEKQDLDRARDSRRDQQPYASEVDDREVERAGKEDRQRAPATPERK